MRDMERRDFVRRSGAAVFLLTGCLGGGETPENDDGNTTGNGDGEENGNQTQNQDGGEGTETDGEGDGEDEADENEGDDGTDEEDVGYTEFMYDPEQAGVNADGYFFTYTGNEASQEMSERVQSTDTSGRTARIEIRETETESEGEGLPQQGDVDIVSVRMYEQEGSFGELRTGLNEPVESYVGYEIYETGGSVIAVNNDRLTVIEGSTTERVRLAAGTLAGETPSYADSNDDIRVLTDAVGTGDAVLIRGGLPEVDVPEIEDAIATAVSLTEDGETVSLRYAVVYPDEEGASAAVSAESLEEEPPGGSGVPSDQLTPILGLAVTELNVRPEDVEVTNQTTEGRVAVLNASVERNAFFGGL
jgi:hypothetical protein